MQSEIALLILKLHSQLLINLHSIKGAIKKKLHIILLDDRIPQNVWLFICSFYI